MKYVISEKDYFIVPETDKRCKRDPGGFIDTVIWTREETKTVDSFKAVLEAANAFMDVWPSAEPYGNGYGPAYDENETTIMYLISDLDADMKGKLYEPLHIFDVVIKE